MPKSEDAFARAQQLVESARGVISGSTSPERVQLSNTYAQIATAEALIDIAETLRNLQGDIQWNVHQVSVIDK